MTDSANHIGFQYPYEEKLIALAKTQDALTKKKVAMAQLLSDFQNKPEYLALKEEIGVLVQDYTGLENEIKDMAEHDLQHNGVKKPHKLIGFRRSTVFTYDMKKAIDWCDEFLPEAVILDVNLFEKHALAVENTKKVPGVEIVRISHATIAQSCLKDLLPPAPSETPAPAPAPATAPPPNDDQIPF
jgi:hypothetical protein